MNIKVLGTGCKKCLTLEARVKDVVQKNNIDASVDKVTDINKIMEYGIMMTPGLVIDGVVKSSGILPKEEQILSWLKNN
jgi:small redox-active disulfide protein 2